MNCRERNCLFMGFCLGGDNSVSAKILKIPLSSALKSKANIKKKMYKLFHPHNKI